MLAFTVKKARFLLLVAFAAISVSSLSLSFISYIPRIAENQSNAGAYVIAAVFWLGLILFLAANYSLKKLLSDRLEALVLQKRLEKQLFPGAVKFSAGLTNIVVYIIIILGLGFIISDIICNYIPEKIMFPILTVTILSFAVHSVIDGKYYKVYKQIKESVNYEKKH